MHADRGLLDHPPWQRLLADVAILWTDPTTGRWRYARWPQDEIGRFIAPLDLCVGHVLAFISPDNHAVYTWVADISTTSIAVVASDSAEAAHRAGAAAATLWVEHQTATVRAAWQRRLASLAD